MNPTTNTQTRDAIQLLVAVMMLTMGGTVYLLIRSQSLLWFRVIEHWELSDMVKGWRKAIDVHLPEWVTYCLPDALWSGAYILIVDVVTQGHPTRLKLGTAAIVPTIGVVSEMMQLHGVLPGTFDPLDIAAYAIPYIIYIITLKKQ